MVTVENGLFEIEFIENIQVQLRPRIGITGSLVIGGEEVRIQDLRYRNDHLYGN